MQELLDRVYLLARARMETPAEDWDTCLVEFAATTLDTFLEYPAIAVTATSLTTSGPGELDSMELMLACFSEAGLQGRELAEQYAIFGSYVLAGAAGLARDLADPAGQRILRVVCRPDAGRTLAPPTGHSRAATTSWPLSSGKYSFAGVKQIIAAAKEKAQNQGPDSRPNAVVPLEPKTPWVHAADTHAAEAVRARMPGKPHAQEPCHEAMHGQLSLATKMLPGPRCSSGREAFLHYRSDLLQADWRKVISRRSLPPTGST